MCWVGTSTSQKEQRICFKFEEIMRWWRFANTTGVWGALSRGYGVKSFLVSPWRPPRTWLSTWTKGKLISAHMYLLLSPSSHLARHICLPVLASLLSLGTPPRSSSLDSVSRVCLLSSPGQMVPASSAEGAAAQSALQWPGCPLSQRWVKAWRSPPPGPCAISNSLTLSWQPYHPTS